VNNKVVLFLFVCISYILYAPTIGAGFVTDFVGFLQRVEEHGPGGFINSFGFPALQPVLNAFLITFYQLFELNGWGWFFIFSGLHGLNAFLVFKLAHRLSKIHLNDENIFWPIIAGLIFLCSPYQSEAVVWKVCFNFLFSSFLMLSIFHLLLNYLQSNKGKWIYYSIGLYFFALLTFELPLILPLLLMAYIFIFYPNKCLQISKRFILPLLVLIGLYLIGNKLILSDWVGHYGADTHLNVDIEMMSQNVWKYTAKHLGFVRFYPHKYKQAIFGFFSGTNLSLWYLLLGIGLLVIGYWRRKKWSSSHKLIGFSMLSFYIALVPILNLFFYSLMYLENDRYGYFPSAFLALSLIFIFRLLPKSIGIGLATLYLLFSVHFLVKMNGLWASSNRVVQGLFESYEWEKEEEVYLLNLPANMHGVYMFGDHTGNHQAFTPSLIHLANKKPIGSVQEIIQYNLTKEDNYASATQDSLGNINLELSHWGSWWWRKNLKNKAYENETYSVKFSGRKYHLEPKESMDNAVFLIHDGLKWKRWNYE